MNQQHGLSSFTPVSQRTDGVLIEFYQMPAGGDEADAVCWFGLRFDVRYWQQNDAAHVVERVRQIVSDAHTQLRALARREYLQLYDITEPSTAVGQIYQTLLWNTESCEQPALAFILPGDETADLQMDAGA